MEIKFHIGLLWQLNFDTFRHASITDSQKLPERESLNSNFSSIFNVESEVILNQTLIILHRHDIWPYRYQMNHVHASILHTDLFIIWE
jgi:hypothetical protein